VLPIRATPLYHKMFIHKLISLLLYMALLLLNGVLLNPSNLRKVLRRQLWVPLGGIVPWHRFANQGCHLNS
jgi:hypothetical protein